MRNTAPSKAKPLCPPRRMRTGTLHESYGMTKCGNPATPAKLDEIKNFHPEVRSGPVGSGNQEEVHSDFGGL